MDRRNYLKMAGGTLGATAGVAVTGSMLSGASVTDQLTDQLEGGPPNDGDWELTFEELFSSDSLDTSNWGIGWGWGRKTSTSPTRAVPENVAVRNGSLRLRGTHEGDDIRAGVVNTKNKVTFGPGSYFEAKIQFADREGFQNAFWSKPNTEAWPPEIDVVELWNDGSGWDDTHVAHHHLHYPASTEPGDDSTHRGPGVTSTPGDDLTANFHTYAVEWRDDALLHYVDGRVVSRWLDDTILTAMRKAAPHYLMLSLNIDNIGTASRDETWGEQMEIDWVRLWETA